MLGIVLCLWCSSSRQIKQLQFYLITNITNPVLITYSINGLKYNQDNQNLASAEAEINIQNIFNINR